MFILTHPVSFPCGRKPEHPEKTHDFRQSVDWLFSHESVARIEPTISEVKGACSDDDCATEAPCSVPHLTDKALFCSFVLFIPGKNWDLRIVQRPDSAIHGIMNFMGVIFWGGAQYSLPEQANLTLIFFSPKLLGGGHQKCFSGHTQKNFYRTYLQTFYNIFSNIEKKFFVIFAIKDTNIFFYDITIFQKSLCFARMSQWFLPPPMPPPRPIRPWIEFFNRYKNLGVVLTL